MERKWTYKWSYQSPGCPATTAAPGQSQDGKPDQGAPQSQRWPATAVAMGQLCGRARGPGGGAGTGGSAPRAGPKPPVLFLTAFPNGASPGQGLQSPSHPGSGLGNGLVPITSRILFLVLPVAFSCLYRGMLGQIGGWQPASLAPVCPLPLWHFWCVSTPALISLAFSSEIFSLS